MCHVCLFSFSELNVWHGQEVLQEARGGREPILGWGVWEGFPDGIGASLERLGMSIFLRVSNCETMLKTYDIMFQML